MASESFTNEDVNRILFLGVHKYQWDDLGATVVYSLFGAGTHEQVELKVSGLDRQARDYVESLLELSNVLVSVGSYDFDHDYNKKLQFVRTLQDPILLLFREHLNRARIEQADFTRKSIENLKKGARTHSSELSGTP